MSSNVNMQASSMPSIQWNINVVEKGSTGYKYVPSITNGVLTWTTDDPNGTPPSSLDLVSAANTAAATANSAASSATSAASSATSAASSATSAASSANSAASAANSASASATSASQQAMNAYTQAMSAKTAATTAAALANGSANAANSAANAASAMVSSGNVVISNATAKIAEMDDKIDDADDVIAACGVATSGANTATENATTKINQVNAKLIEINDAIEEAEDATEDAISAKDRANTAAAQAETIVTEAYKYKVPAGGSTNQVLAKKSNTDYDFKWVDGGSGGVSDHSQLTNLDYAHSGHTGFASTSALNAVEAIAKGAQVALTVNSYSALVTLLNDAVAQAYNVGQNFYVVTQEVPDIWISVNNEETSVPYTYVSDAQLISDVNAGSGKLQIGKHKISFLETQKVDLSAYRTSAAQDVIDIGKVDKVTGKGLSENDFTTAYKNDVDANTAARVTSTERTSWNAKMSGIVQDPDNQYGGMVI